MELVDTVVIGAGVVGLAVARALQAAGRDVLLLEATGGIGNGISSRNSEVIHAGLYYPPGSLKARLCVEGRRLLYRYAAERAVEARPIGKLVVASDAGQTGALAALRDNAERNGVEGLRLIDGAQALALEPELRVVAALHSPVSGVIDSHALMLALLGDFENDGGTLVLEAPVIGGQIGETAHRLEIGGRDPITITARLVVNAAGLAAPRLARALAGMPAARIPEAHLAKGNYFSLSGARAPFRRLIYPLPEQAGLGVHATIDLAGRVRFGPDVEWVEHEDYAVDPARAPIFAEAIRRYWPGLPEDALAPDYAGIRPKISGPGTPSADFRIDGPKAHGIEGLWHLFGIESPGLTACLAIARAVADQAGA